MKKPEPRSRLLSNLICLKQILRDGLPSTVSDFLFGNFPTTPAVLPAGDGYASPFSERPIGGLGRSRNTSADRYPLRRADHRPARRAGRGSAGLAHCVASNLNPASLRHRLTSYFLFLAFR